MSAENKNKSGQLEIGLYRKLVRVHSERRAVESRLKIRQGGNLLEKVIVRKKTFSPELAEALSEVEGEAEGEVVK